MTSPAPDGDATRSSVDRYDASATAGEVLRA